MGRTSQPAAASTRNAKDKEPNQLKGAAKAPADLNVLLLFLLQKISLLLGRSRAETDMFALQAPAGNESAGENAAPAAVLAGAARARAQTNQLVKRGLSPIDDLEAQ